MIDLGLCAVGEIAELRFPEDEHVGAVQGVAIIEAENGRFGEGAIVDAEGGLILGKIFQRNIAGAGAKIVNGGVAMAECAAPTILA